MVDDVIGDGSDQEAALCGQSAGPHHDQARLLGFGDTADRVRRIPGLDPTLPAHRGVGQRERNQRQRIRRERYT